MVTFPAFNGEGRPQVHYFLKVWAGWPSGVEPLSLFKSSQEDLFQSQWQDSILLPGQGGSISKSTMLSHSLIKFINNLNI